MATHLVFGADFQVGDPRPFALPGGERGGVGQFGLEFLGLEAPQRNQPADPGVEQAFALGGELLRVADQRRQLGLDWPRSTGRQRRIQRAQLRRLPGMVVLVQAVEFAEHGGDGAACALGFAADHDDFDAGAEDVGLLFLQGRRAAGGEQQRAEQQPGTQ